MHFWTQIGKPQNSWLFDGKKRLYVLDVKAMYLFVTHIPVESAFDIWFWEAEQENCIEEIIVSLQINILKWVH